MTTDIKMLALSSACLAGLAAAAVLLISSCGHSYSRAVRLAREYCCSRATVKTVDAADLIDGEDDRELRQYFLNVPCSEASMLTLDSDTAYMLGDVIAGYEDKSCQMYLGGGRRVVSEKTREGCTEGFQISCETDTGSPDHLMTYSRIAHYSDESCVRELHEVERKWREKYTAAYPDGFEERVCVPPVYAGTSESSNAFFRYEVFFAYDSENEKPKTISLSCTYFSTDLMAESYVVSRSEKEYREFLRYLKKQGVSIPDEISGLPDNIERESYG